MGLTSPKSVHITSILCRFESIVSSSIEPYALIKPFTYDFAARLAIISFAAENMLRNDTHLRLECHPVEILAFGRNSAATANHPVETLSGIVPSSGRRWGVRDL